MDIFAVDREGVRPSAVIGDFIPDFAEISEMPVQEAARFAPHANNPNRRLLWHGSRLTNWVGILSQGTVGLFGRLID